MRISGSGCSILIPRARIATHRVHAIGARENPRRTHGPLASEAIMTARCEMLLSPGNGDFGFDARRALYPKVIHD